MKSKSWTPRFVGHLAPLYLSLPQSCSGLCQASRLKWSLHCAPFEAWVRCQRPQQHQFLLFKSQKQLRCPIWQISQVTWWLFNLFWDFPSQPFRCSNRCVPRHAGIAAKALVQRRQLRQRQGRAAHGGWEEGLLSQATWAFRVIFWVTAIFGCFFWSEASLEKVKV